MKVFVYDKNRIHGNATCIYRRQYRGWFLIIVSRRGSAFTNVLKPDRLILPQRGQSLSFSSVAAIRGVGTRSA